MIVKFGAFLTKFTFYLKPNAPFPPNPSYYFDNLKGQLFTQKTGGEEIMGGRGVRYMVEGLQGITLEG